MQLKITLERSEALSNTQDLGYLLHKNPANVQSFDLAWGTAHIFYPECSAERTSCVLMLDIDPVRLIRGSGKKDSRNSGPMSQNQNFALSQYVNDRPFCASSFLSVAIAQTLNSALSGKSRERQELADTALDFKAEISVVYSTTDSGEEFLSNLFTPLGYEVLAENLPLDTMFPEWGKSRYYKLTLKGKKTLSDLLSHIYVLIPVLDNDKHYQVDRAEVEKLLRHGEGWLANHPLKSLIVTRYLKHSRSLISGALEKLIEETPETLEDEEKGGQEEEKLEEKISLNTQRQNAVIDALKQVGARTVIDLGCGEGRLLKLILDNKELPGLTNLSGMDVSGRSLTILGRRLRQSLEQNKVNVFQGSLTYRDARLKGFDAATCVEVVEHLDADRLPAFEKVVFEQARPRAVIVTTPNIEYNVKFESLRNGKLRHRDHRFEFTRQEFNSWCQSISERFGYKYAVSPIGDFDEAVGAPTQMAVFQL